MGKKTTQLVAEKIEKIKKKIRVADTVRVTAGTAAVISAMGLAGALVIGGVSDRITDVCSDKILSDMRETQGYQTYATDRRHELSAKLDLREISYEEFIREYGAIGTNDFTLQYAREAEDEDLNLTAENYDTSRDFAHTFTHKVAPAMLIAGLGSGFVCGVSDIAKTTYELRLENYKKKQEESELAD
jgi:hypothetical protein